MILTTIHIKSVLAAGGSLIVDAAKMTPNQVEEIVAALPSHAGARLTLKNVGGITAHHLEVLSALAPGQVVFDTT